jgi:hypothetical protein
MKELIQLFTQIALLRRGPQDVPASMLLLVIVVIGYSAINLLTMAALPEMGGWLPHRLAVDVIFTLLWYVSLLNLVGRPERILQTTTAVFGFQCITEPPLALSNWLVQRFENTSWQLPVSLLFLVLVVWVIAAYSHVVQAALEWSGLASVAVVILYMITGDLVLFALFPSTT